MKLASTLSWSAFATLIRLANGFVSVKVVALLVGPVGIALIGQFGNFNTIVMTLALGGISSGIIKYTSQYKDDINSLQKVWQTASWVSCVLMVPTIIILIVFHNWLSLEFFNDSRYGSILVVFAFSLLFYVANNLLLNILNGLHDIKIFNILNTINSVVGLLITILLTYHYKLYGALLAMVTSQSVSFIISIIFVRKRAWFKAGNFLGKFDRYYFNRLMGFTVMSLTSLCVIPTSQMFVRGYLAKNTSWNIAGCWQGMQKISDSYLMIVYTALGTYFLPKLANLECRKQITSEIVKGYKLLMPFVIVSAVIIYLLRDFIIHILFARTFTPMRDMFFWQLTGDCFKTGSYILAYLMLAKAKTKIFMITEMVFGSSFVVLSYIFIQSNGADGAVMAFALNYALYFVLFIILYKKGYLF